MGPYACLTCGQDLPSENWVLRVLGISDFIFRCGLGGALLLCLSQQSRCVSPSRSESFTTVPVSEDLTTPLRYMILVVLGSPNTILEMRVCHQRPLYRVSCWRWFRLGLACGVGVLGAPLRSCNTMLSSSCGGCFF